MGSEPSRRKATAALIEQLVLAPLEPRLKAEGIERRGRRFQVSDGAAQGVLSLISSPLWEPERTYVTAEFGVAFSVIQQWSGEPQITSPTVLRCHLRSRLGWFMATGEDRWWQLTVDPWPEPMPELTGGVAAGLVDAVVDVGVPVLRRLMQPGEAIGYWLGEHAGFFGYEEPLRYAAIMAASTESSRHLLPEIMARARELEFPSPGLASELERIMRMAEQASANRDRERQ